MLKKITNTILNIFKQVFLKYFQYPLQGYWARRRIQLSDEDILPKDTRYFLGLVAIFRGEDDYLIEWIEFHRIMGVEHFILYDNGLAESSKQILNKYIKCGIVTHIPFPHVPGTRDGKHADTLSDQQLAYGDCINRFSHHFQWLIEIDIDEFMFPKKHRNLCEALKIFSPKKVTGVEINWTNFGNNGHIHKPTGLVIENYTKSAETVDKYTVKSIGNPNFFSKWLRHSNMHHFTYKFSIILYFTKLILGYPKIITGETANNLLQLNHYRTKSKEEYARKFIINQGGYITDEETEDKFIKLNKQFNNKDDYAILRFLPELKKRINSELSIIY